MLIIAVQLIKQHWIEESEFPARAAYAGSEREGVAVLDEAVGACRRSSEGRPCTSLSLSICIYIYIYNTTTTTNNNNDNTNDDNNN